MKMKYIKSPNYPGRQLAMGLTGDIRAVDESYVVKHPKSDPDSSEEARVYNEMKLEMMNVERQIYERLGLHDSIIHYYGPLDNSGAIKLAYAKQGDLEKYITGHEMPSKATRIAWIRSLIEGFYHIYSSKVLHQDIKPNNVVVHDGSVKIIDFANGEIFPPDADMEKVFTDDPLAKGDLCGIASVIYSVSAWRVFYYEFFEDNQFPRPDEIPDTEALVYREIIDKCWRNEYHSVRSLYEDFQKHEKEVIIPDLEKDGKPRMEFMLWFCAVPSLLLLSGRFLCAGFR
ncbi:ULK protein kinase [Trichophyton tonsurans CBS 112818]|uniref:ULK protein kinase n=1 Tax=Trichophyton tonsurans (strain CBS 112818) TaxID=647933 RepID=F2RQQ8_TRIT1|nr:ULK protein kinase [Trichophyton tonsurans CBS 112818]